LLIDPVLPAALDGMRVRVVLQQREIEIVYRVRGAGCGVSALHHDGRPLAFNEEANPYRRGAARVPLRDLDAALASARQRELVVHVGETANS